MSATAEKPALPGSLNTNRSLDRWLRFEADATLGVRVGKVELGQGILTALAQIAADELDLRLDQVRIVTASTEASPNEGMTSGSRSVEESGEALRYACAEVRALALEAAAHRLGVSIEKLQLAEGVFHAGGKQASYWDLAAEIDLAREASGRVSPKQASDLALVGRSAARIDLPAKVFGEPSYVQDIDLPGMVHGRVVRPVNYAATLSSVDAEAVRALPGVIAVVRDGNFLGVVAEREEQAIRAQAALAKGCRWDAPRGLPGEAKIYDYLLGCPVETAVISDKRDADAKSRADVTLQATYRKPYIAHASIGPSCAVARYDGDRFEIWSHSQGIFPLRGDMVKCLRVPAERIVVHHTDGSGCYGHNGADDVALDAALLARAASPRPVKVQWMREEEFGWEPFGPAMVMKLSASLDRSGAVVDWNHDVWSNPHSNRSGRGAGSTLIAAPHLAAPVPVSPPVDMPLPAGASHRNAIPLYDFPSEHVARHLITDTPLRISALRALGGFANVFAIESMMDELAASCGADPVAFRLRHLKDPRACAVIERAAQMAGWKAGEKGDGTRGRGIGFCKYKNLGSYCAVIAEVVLEQGLRVVRAWAAVDVGRVVNPDGVVNQIEGGIVQATSWTLKEAVRFDTHFVTSRQWADYPILTFGEAPHVQVSLIDRPGEPSKGAGEGAQGPTGGAIANALFNAIGVRVRELPLTRERIATAIG
ncbi:MAG: xanthine dehydrogenase family protein molybdopterin-binding subunit [Burkholderiales bacterium]|nr:xanthine dehydrogenase family protein molybdopterin-binding subunit [Burkholderiales bacterium]